MASLRISLAIVSFTAHEALAQPPPHGAPMRPMPLLKHQGCSYDRFVAPPVPDHPLQWNGVQLQSVCFNQTIGAGDTAKPDAREHHVFVIGDWGGVLGPHGLYPADRRSPEMPEKYWRDFVIGADDCAQWKVAGQMNQHAAGMRVDFIVNVGDNFYWGGLTSHCGQYSMHQHPDPGQQWSRIYEAVYSRPNLRHQQWLGVLGNHDWGGYMFTSAWDQTMAYTWALPGHSSGRWFTPALFYAVTTYYEDFSIDWIYVDSNVFDAMNPQGNQGHNICSIGHNEPHANCTKAQGPSSIWDCPAWFQKLWDQEMVWVEEKLSQSSATWQIVVTHFPPEWGKDQWMRLAWKYGIDLFITGHRHTQEVWGPYNKGNRFRPTPYIVSGGGGGITSEKLPNATGHDMMYGFMDLTLTKDVITIDAISHGGIHTSRTKFGHRQRAPEGEPWPPAHYAPYYESRPVWAPTGVRVKFYNEETVTSTTTDMDWTEDEVEGQTPDSRIDKPEDEVDEEDEVQMASHKQKEETVDDVNLI